jgi:hypothetical protein
VLRIGQGEHERDYSAVRHTDNVGVATRIESKVRRNASTSV